MTRLDRRQKMTYRHFNHGDRSSTLALRAYHLLLSDEILHRALSGTLLELMTLVSPRSHRRAYSNPLLDGNLVLHYTSRYRILVTPNSSTRIIRTISRYEPRKHRMLRLAQAQTTRLNHHQRVTMPSVAACGWRGCSMVEGSGIAKAAPMIATLVGRLQEATIMMDLLWTSRCLHHRS